MARTIEIVNTLPAGNLFTSCGKLPAGEKMKLPADEAKTFIKLGKAARAEDIDEATEHADDEPPADSASLL